MRIYPRGSAPAYMRGHQEYEEECTQHLHAALKSEVVKQVHETKEHEDARATLPEDRPTTLSVIKHKSGKAKSTFALFLLLLFAKKR